MGECPSAIASAFTLSTSLGGLGFSFVRLVGEGAPTPCQAGGQNHQPGAQSPDLQELTSLGCGFTVCLGITRFVGIGSYSRLSSWDTETRAGET